MDCKKCPITTSGKKEELAEICSQCGWGLNTPEPMSIPNDNPAIWDLVEHDIKERDELGLLKYKTRLQGFNGRDALKDAYQEALDLSVYLRQAIFERDGI